MSIGRTVHIMSSEGFMPRASAVPSPAIRRYIDGETDAPGYVREVEREAEQEVQRQLERKEKERAAE